MKTRLLKNASLFVGLVILASCSGPKDSKNNNIVPTVGPQGHIQASGSQNQFCDIENGRIVCSYRNPNTQALCSINRSYNEQDLANFCEQMRSIRSDATLPGGCNVQEIADHILRSHCLNHGGVQPPNSNPNWPNPGFPPPMGPGNPGGPFPGNSGRVITCNVDSGGLRTQLLVPAALSRGFAWVELRERLGGVLGAIGLSRRSGEVRVNFHGAQGNLPETLTATIKYTDRANRNRDTLAKHSGFAGAPLSIDANINGAQISVSCNEGMAISAPVNESATLVCQGRSHITGSTYEENIQFTRQISTMNSGEEVSLSEAVRISLNKESGRLMVHTNVDSTLGPSMTSSSSLRSNLLVEASETIGKAKFTCSVR